LDTFTVKEFFEDATRGEVLFLNKALKRLVEIHNLPVVKATLAGERFPSNHWPFKLVEHACALLVGLRRGESRDDLIRSYVEYPALKGWGLTPYYDGEWEEFATQLGVDVYNQVEVSDSDATL